MCNQSHAPLREAHYRSFISESRSIDIRTFTYRYFGSYYWQGSAGMYWRHSPLAYVSAVQTPLLIFHGLQDSRVPPSQSQALYTALSLQHKPVKLLLNPDQGHEPTNPLMILNEISAINQWLQIHQSP
jgi:dipeptidyl aminopeptidase/acylaminoacyl peptidase